MARPKNPDFKTKTEEIREKMDEERQSRMEKQEILEDVDARESFREYWAVNKKSFNQSKEVEEVVWAHLKAIEHDQPELFEIGVGHFGFNK
jgi:ribosome biogenesis protein Nip4